MNQSQNGNNQDTWMYVVVGIGSIAFALFFSGAIFLGLLLGAILVSSLGDASPDKRLRTALIAAMFFVLTIILIGTGVRFRGLLFSDVRDMTNDFTMYLVDLFNNISPLKKRIENIRPGRLRFYLWMTWPVATALFTFSMIKGKVAKDFWFNAARGLNWPLAYAFRSWKVAALAAVVTATICAFFKMPTLAFFLLTIIFFEFVYEHVLNFGLRVLDFESPESGDRVIIGKTNGSGQTVSITEKQLNHHVHVVGASGLVNQFFSLILSGTKFRRSLDCCSLI